MDLGPGAVMTALPRRHALALLGLCALLRVVTLFTPCMSDDEATYCVVGREMLHGRALYRDVVDHKPPAIYVVNEVTQALGGTTGGQFVLHVLLIGVVWLTGMLLAAIVRRFGGAPAFNDADVAARDLTPLCAALLWVVFTTTLVDTDSLAANCELFMMLPIVASVYAFLASRWLACGVLVGAAMLFKYQAGIQLPLFGLVLLVRDRDLRAIVRSVVIGIGAAVPIAAVVAYLTAKGAWSAGWFWFRFNFAYIDAGATGALVQQMALRVAFTVLAAAPLYALGALALRERPPQALETFRRITLAWLVASCAAVLVGGRFFGHYFHQITAPLAVLAAPAAARWLARSRRTFVTALAVPAAIFLALSLAHDPLMRAAGEPDPDYASVVRWLDAHGPRDEALCIWGNSPVLYFEAARPLGCRFVFANYLTGLSPATPSQTDPSVDSSRQAVPVAWDLLEADFADRKPAWFVDGAPGNVAFYGKYPIDRFPRLAHVLACDYQEQAFVAGMRIYRRLAVSRCLQRQL